MTWSYYYYLISMLFAALVLALVLYRLIPVLAPAQETPHRTPAELGVLLAATAVGLGAIYLNYYRGLFSFGWWDVGSDTMEQYVPYYLNMLESLRSGSLGLWNHSYGLGTSFMSYQSWTLDPFNLLVIVPLCLTFGDSFLSLALVIAHSLKIVLSAVLFDHLLTWYCRTPLARILGSLLYAFSGYLILWGQHYWLGGICVMQIALLVALELLRDRWSIPRFMLVAALSALSIIESTYTGFMVMLFAASYALVRAAHDAQVSSLGSFLRLYGRLALPAICGVLISCVTLVPYAILMLGESSRVVSADSPALSTKALTSLKTFIPLGWAFPVLSRLLGNTLISCGEAIPPEAIPPAEGLLTRINIYEFASYGLSCGVFIYLLQWLHWLLFEARTRTKVFSFFGLLFVALYCCNAFLPALNNVFAEVKYRSSYIVVLLICLAIAVGFEQRTVLHRPVLPLVWVAAAGTGVVLAWSFFNTVDGRLTCLGYLVALVALTFVLQASQSRNMSSIAVLVCIILVGSQIMDGFFATNRRNVSMAEDFPAATTPNKATDTAEALAYIKAQDDSFYRIEKLDYYDWSSYNDSLAQSYPAISTYNSTLDADVEEFFAKLWPNINLFGDVAYPVYRNDTDQPTLASMLGVRYLLSYEPSDKPWITEMKQFGHVHVYKVNAESSALTLYTSTVPESEADMQGNAPARALLLEHAAIVPDGVAASVTAAAAGETTPTAVPLVLRQQHLIAESSTSSESIACLAIPHTTGWHITIDGEEVDTFRANYGFIGFKVPAGNHRIEASFVPKGARIGCLLMAAGVLFSLVCCVAGHRVQHRSASRI